MEISIELTKNSVQEILDCLNKRNDELFEQQVVAKAIGNNVERQKCLEEFMVVQDLLSQFELIKEKIK